MMMLKKKKPNACQACYDSRVKCTYGSDKQGRCERCVKVNRICTPRIILRGKASQANKPEWENAEGGEGGLDFEAFRSLSILEPRPEAAVHYSAAAACVKTYKGLGLEKPPTSLKWFCNLLFLMAAEQKSVSRLHAATTLAVSTDTVIDVTFLSIDEAPISRAKVQEYDSLINSSYFANIDAGPCFVVRHENGFRDLITNPAFDFFFTNTNGSAIVDDAENPHISFWRPFFKDRQVSDRFAADILKNLITAAEPDEREEIRWSFDFDEQVDIVDKWGNEYRTRPYEEGFLIAKGYLVFMTIRFREIIPLTEGGAQKLREFEAFKRSNAPLFAQPRVYRGVSTENPTYVVSDSQPSVKPTSTSREHPVYHSPDVLQPPVKLESQQKAHVAHLGTAALTYAEPPPQSTGQHQQECQDLEQPLYTSEIVHQVVRREDFGHSSTSGGQVPYSEPGSPYAEQNIHSSERNAYGSISNMWDESFVDVGEPALWNAMENVVSRFGGPEALQSWY